MRILITGSNGLLGQKLVMYCLHHQVDFLATSRGENRNPDCPTSNYVTMDITDKLEIQSVFQSYYPTHVIHTAAITNVDFCELHPDECQVVNVEATAMLFEASIEYRSHFVFLSTDFVFDGKTGYYKETDEVNPLSVYATSKVDAEKILLKSDYKKWTIARTIIVYGRGHNMTRSNLILWAIDALTKGQPMNIIDDQFRMPTWADDLALGCMEICLREKEGIFHLCGPELMSIYEIVERVAKFLDKPMDHVKRISSTTLNQPAKRPPRTGFDLTKSRKELEYSPKTLEETLDELVKNH